MFMSTYTDHRHFNFIYETLDTKIKHILNREGLQHKSDIIIISGMATGPDEIAANYASDKHIPLITFPAEWKRYGKKAGFIRNSEMLKHAEYVIAFYDGQSNGTKHTLREAKKLHKPCKTFVLDCNL